MRPKIESWPVDRVLIDTHHQMNEDPKLARWLNPRRVSFLVIVGLLLLAPVLHLTTPLLTILLSTFALRKFDLWGKRQLSVLVFICAVCLISFGFVVFTRNAARALPGPR